jgi:ribonuclease J
MTNDTLPLRVIPLGGLGEIGRNMMLYEYGDDMIAVDVGVMFPDAEHLGVDLIIPDFTYVK